MKQLTKAEEEIMRILWKLNESDVKGIIEHLPSPKPAYNTVSTIVRILENKGFVGHKPKKGKGYIYFPLIAKSEYSRQYLKRIINKFFDGSFENMVSFFARKEKINLRELERILEELKRQK